MSEKIIVEGGKPLNGFVNISGSKNAALPIIAASILVDKLVLTNIPNLMDVSYMISLLGSMGFNLTIDEGEKVIIEKGEKINLQADYDIVSKMRASILVLGPALARFGKVKVSMPGGCDIGGRPIDLHIEGLKALGAIIEVIDGFVIAKAPNGLKGGRFKFKKISVTGTENLLMAAVLSKGTVVLENCAIEPEISDLVECLQKMGAKIDGIGTRTLFIEGVDALESTEYKVMQDRIEAATFMIATAVTKGLVEIDMPINHLETVTSLLKESTNILLEDKGETILIDARNVDDIKPFNIETKEYPGYPTDVQAQTVVLATIANGKSVIVENIFENRFKHCFELKRMGAMIEVTGNTILVNGVKNLTGAKVKATDLRASASLISAGLVANGFTEIRDTYHIDRGYEFIEEKLYRLGAIISRKEESNIWNFV